jgi:hypothetical protein
MTVRDLPTGDRPSPLKLSHFPTSQQAVVWRNWGLVDPERIASALGTTSTIVETMGKDMGLAPPPVPGDPRHRFSRRGYLTIIRANWHLLPFEQILALLEWDPDRMHRTLLEEDFLWNKLGRHKPDTPPIRYRELTTAETERTAELKDVTLKHFPSTDSTQVSPPFSFLDAFDSSPGAAGLNPPEKRTGLRIIHSYFGSAGDVLLNTDRLDPYPSGLLAAYARVGINAIWLHGILYQLYPWRPAGELSRGFEKRLENLRALVERADAWGIKTFLYLNEPRGLPEDLYGDHPHLRGASHPDYLACALCTSNGEVLKYLEEASASLFSRVPGLGGAITITMSENLTHCHSKGFGETCPRCRDRSVGDVIAETNSAIARGIHSAAPSARVIAWNWAWKFSAAPKTHDWTTDVLKRIPTDIALMCTSEEGMPVEFGNDRANVLDYSISQVGPGEKAKRSWRYARENGNETVAKVQMNNTWELAAVPYLPVPYLTKRHLGNLKDIGIDRLMLSWTLGGYPSMNLKLLDKGIEELSVEMFGPSAAATVRKAWRLFSSAFEEFPFNIQTAYYAPQNFGPMNLLFGDPTNYRATMVGFPYDDLESWAGAFSPETLERQFDLLAGKWSEGLTELDRAMAVVSPDFGKGLQDHIEVAAAAYCHFRSSLLQMRFVRLRGIPTGEALDSVVSVLHEEIDLAKRLFDIVGRDSRIGFEASNHYFYTRNDLREKVLNCENLLEFYNADPKRRNP